jgi:hypothetical protein
MFKVKKYVLPVWSKYKHISKAEVYFYNSKYVTIYCIYLYIYNKTLLKRRIVNKVSDIKHGRYQVMLVNEKID